ncbi:MAG: 3-deoxy-D-manno-octulosonic acid transferase [Rhodospirillales bacterium]
MIYRLYRAATISGLPLINGLLAKRLRGGKEDRLRINERRGRTTRPRPDGRLIWAHAASVGESLSLLPLIERMTERWPDLRFLVTTGTVTSAALMTERLPASAFHQFIPLDRPAWVARFLDHWKPDLAIWAESELWPNMLMEMRKRSIPSILVNGRLSERSAKRWRLAPSLSKALLGGFDICLAQSLEERQRFAALGARNAKALGNLKFAAPPLPVREFDLALLRKSIGERPVWIAASTHPTEEATIAAAHQSLKDKHPGLLTIIVPRHNTRGPEITDELVKLGLSVCRRSVNETLHPATDIYLADTMGELGLFYRIAPIVFVGGSLIRHGGQNPLEPARFGCAILHGPNMFNFSEIMGDFTSYDASIEVSDAESLTLAVDQLLSQPDSRTRIGESARQRSLAQADVLDNVTNEVARFLDHPADHSDDRASA